ncbi:MAG: DUF1801 domain-containing protein [Anaerosomatales bacterium]|nr:DUF1801 domain-containing protein [Anaerosomatales bacterium]MDT8434165.1 DUF1801 domain-containing protein [Anaerosomatales bacterium]
MDRSAALSVDDYIEGFPPETRVMLEDIRSLVREIVPDATETISYQMPTFDLNGAHFVHFAGYDTHIGFYPIPTGIEAFKEELGAYKTGKGSVRFPLDQPLPLDLIRRIVEFRAEENRRRAAK